MPDLVANIPRRRGNKNKPDESKWRQQTLPAYRPLLTARCAMPITLIVGVTFICTGVLLYLVATAGKEIVIDYTNCTMTNGTFEDLDSFISKQCFYNITLEENFDGAVKFQYGLERFFQNSRMYIKSRNDLQLFGHINETADCEPFAKSNSTGQMLAIVPCGSIANSMFNDTFVLYYLPLDGSEEVLVPFSTKNVIWKNERRRKFRNPSYDATKNQTLCDAFIGTVKPPNWIHPICELGKNDPMANQDPDVGFGLENIDFIVWMKPAALPKFRKTYRTLNRTTALFTNGLPKGNYVLKIQYNYPVNNFDGKKRFIIALDMIGPSSPFLGIAYMTFGLFSVLVTAVFFILHLRQQMPS
uniref:Cell cycle control protein 50A n=1 Tax=Parascaris univalens TaxID=6257 RepID=A0A914ZT87_PARUN